MTTLSRNALLPLAVLAVILASGGCGLGKNGAPTNLPPPDGPPGPGAGDGGGPPSNVRQIMNRLGKGPRALTPVIGKELEAEPPSWDTLQPQAKEYAQLTAALGQYDPPRGSKESWAKQTAAYADAAAALDRAARAKDTEAARAAHTRLSDSCIGCHSEHRQKRPGAGG
jgi:hypothetical protein